MLQVQVDHVRGVFCPVIFKGKRRGSYIPKKFPSHARRLRVLISLVLHNWEYEMALLKRN